MNVRRHHWLVLPGVFVVVIATGCGHHAAPTASVPQDTRPPSQVARDLAQNLSTTLSRDHGVPIDQVGTTRLEAAAQGRPDAVRALRSATALDERNLSWSWTVVFYDADGHEQLMFVPGVTARAMIHANVRGSLSSAEHNASVGIERMLDVSGLLPAETELHIDGAAHDTAHCAFEAQDGSAARRYDLLSQGSLEDIRQLKDSSVNPYPLSGVLRWQVAADAFERTGDGEQEAHYDARVVVTFNGTRYPTIEIEEHWRYRMDLQTGEITELPS